MSNVIEFKSGKTIGAARATNRSNDSKPVALDADSLALDMPAGIRHVDGLRRRIFWTTHGWYLRLRDDDVARSRGLGLQYADIRRLGEEVVAGPFRSEDDTLRWFDWFLQSFAEARAVDDPTQTEQFKFYA